MEATVADANGRKKGRAELTTVTHHNNTHQAMPANHPLTGGAVDHVSNGLAQPGQWDHLWKHATEHDEILDFGIEDEEYEDKSEDDGEAVEAMDVDEEESDPPQRLPSRAGKLSEDEVVDVINECIEEYTNAWFVGKTEEQLVDEVQVRHVAESEGTVLQFIERTKTNISALRTRLDALADEVMKDTYRNAEDVRRACRNMELTVEFLEYELWRLNIFEPNADESPNQDLHIIDLGSGSESNSDIELEDAELVSATDKLNVGVHSPSVPKSDVVGGPASSRNQADKLESPLQRPYQPIQCPEPRSNVSTRSPAQPPPLGTQSQAPNQSQHILSTQAHVPGNSHGQTQGTTSSQKVSQSQRHHSSQSLAGSRKAQPAAGDVLLHNRDSPELSSIATVAKWGWPQLVQKHDRKRIVMKIIYEMTSSDREILRTRIMTVRKQNLLMEIPLCVAMLLRGENKIQGVLPRDLVKIVNFTKLFLSWWLCGNYFQEEAEQWQVEELAQCLDDRDTDESEFYYWVHHILENTFSKEALAKPSAPSQAEIIVIDSSDDDAPTPKPKPTSTQKKKREGATPTVNRTPAVREVVTLD